MGVTMVPLHPSPRVRLNIFSVFFFLYIFRLTLNIYTCLCLHLFHHNNNGFIIRAYRLPETACSITTTTTIIIIIIIKKIIIIHVLITSRVNLQRVSCAPTHIFYTRYLKTGFFKKKNSSPQSSFLMLDVVRAIYEIM